MYCPDCGSQNPDHAKFCQNCGIPLSMVPFTSETPAQNVPTEPLVPPAVEPETVEPETVEPETVEPETVIPDAITETASKDSLEDVLREAETMVQQVDEEEDTPDVISEEIPAAVPEVEVPAAPKAAPEEAPQPPREFLYQPVPAAPQVSTTQAPPPTYQPPRSFAPPPPPSTGGSAYEVIKSVARSPIYLIAIICYSIAVILKILAINNSLTLAMVSSVLNEVPELDEVRMYINEMYDAIRVGSITGNVISILIMAVIALGLWMIFAAAHNRRNPGMGTGGLTVVQAMTIVYLCFFGIVAAIGLVALIITIAAVGFSGYGEETIALFVVLGVFIVAAVLVLLWYIFTLTSIGAAKSVLSSRRTVKKPSAYVAIVGWIGALFSLIAIIARISQFAVYFSYSPFAALSTGSWMALFDGIPEIISLIFFGICIFQCRGRINAYRRAQAAQKARQPVA